VLQTILSLVSFDPISYHLISIQKEQNRRYRGENKPGYVTSPIFAHHQQSHDPLESLRTWVEVPVDKR